MLSIFPELFIFTFLAIFVLRMMVGFMLLHFAHRGFFQERAQYKIFFHRFGDKASLNLFKISIALEFILGTLLVIGYSTQIAALIAGSLLFVAFVIKMKRPSLIPYSTPSFFLMLSIVSLMLIFLGPGAFAFDYPL
ncbi:MAG: hypothetical protein AAB628_03035 [Patescibacteria group bacterium]